MKHERTIVMYAEHDPHAKRITFVAIHTGSWPPTVLATYDVPTRDFIPKLPGDVLVVPKLIAERLFDFKKSLAEVVN